MHYKNIKSIKTNKYRHRTPIFNRPQISTNPNSYTVRIAIQNRSYSFYYIKLVTFITECIYALFHPLINHDRIRIRKNLTLYLFHALCLLPAFSPSSCPHIYPFFFSFLYNTFDPDEHLFTINIYY